MIPFKAKYRRNLLRTETIHFTVPTGYGDLSIKQLLDITKWDGKELLKLIQIVTGLTDRVIQSVRSYESINIIASKLAWLMEKVDFMQKNYEQDVPETLLVDGREYAVPTDLKLETFGQKISLQSYLLKAQKDGLSVTECIPMTLAIYFQPIIEERDYDEERAMKLCGLMEGVNLKQAWAIADFFLNNSQQLSSGSLTLCPTIQTAMLYKLASENLNRLVYWVLLTHWPVATYSGMMKCCSKGIRIYLQN